MKGEHISKTPVHNFKDGYKEIKVRNHHHTTLRKVERFIESLKKQVKKLKRNKT